MLGQIDKEEIDKQTKRTIEEMFKRRVDHGQTDIDRDTNGQRDNLNWYDRRKAADNWTKWQLYTQIENWI